MDSKFHDHIHKFTSANAKWLSLSVVLTPENFPETFAHYLPKALSFET
jgi:hypothetical protein